MSDNDFEKGESGALNTELAEAGRMKPGSLIMMKDETFPCKVTAFSTATPGKHGSAKAMITAKDVFTDKQYDETFGTGDMIPRPIIKKMECQCLSIDDGMLQLLTADGDLKEDIPVPTEAHLKDVATKINEILDAGKKECLVQIQKWGDREQAVAVREGQDAD